MKSKDPNSAAEQKHSVSNNDPKINNATTPVTSENELSLKFKNCSKTLNVERSVMDKTKTALSCRNCRRAEQHTLRKPLSEHLL